MKLDDIRSGDTVAFVGWAFSGGPKHRSEFEILAVFPFEDTIYGVYASQTASPPFKPCPHLIDLGFCEATYEDFQVLRSEDR